MFTSFVDSKILSRCHQNFPSLGEEEIHVESANIAHFDRCIEALIRESSSAHPAQPRTTPDRQPVSDFLSFVNIDAIFQTPIGDEEWRRNNVADYVITPPHMLKSVENAEVQTR